MAYNEHDQQLGFSMSAMNRIGPQISQSMTDILGVLETFAEQCLNTEFTQVRDYDSEQDWERISLSSTNPDYAVVVVLLDFCEDFTATVLVGGRQVVETDDPEDIFDMLVQAEELIEGESQK